MKDKKKIALLCFLTDLGLSVWSYAMVKNYDEYLKLVKPVINSPDFQVQLYAVVLQTFIFSALIFLVFHVFIYLLFIKEVNYAIKYVRFYTFMAAFSAGIMMMTGYVLAIIPLIIYLVCFSSVGKVSVKKK